MLTNARPEQLTHDHIDLTFSAIESANRMWHSVLWTANDISRYAASQGLRSTASLLGSSYHLTQAMLGISLGFTQSAVLTWQALLQDANARIIHSVQPPREAVSNLSPEISFYFRGPEGQLNLRADNLEQFVRIARQVDDQTWLYHLNRGDYSHWFRTTLEDETLAGESMQIEKLTDLPPAESRARLLSTIEQRYTIAA